MSRAFGLFSQFNYKETESLQTGYMVIIKFCVSYPIIVAKHNHVTTLNTFTWCVSMIKLRTNLNIDIPTVNFAKFAE